jgi:HD-GYP domain-containing protein (c-di-GMP phosphodiesterase class II)
MAARSRLKRISVSQLIPGMFTVEMDVPWYRTPFLSHKRLIEDRQTIQQIIDCGVQMVTIDVSKGKDVMAAPHSGQSDASAPPAHQPPAETPDSSVRSQAESAQALYAEAHEAMERIFTDLERNLPPSPVAAAAVVSRMLKQIVNDRTALMAHLVYHKLKCFDNSLAAHSLDTCILSLIIAVESGLDEPRQIQLGLGALLHDVGYVRLPRNLVRRRDECSDQERLLLHQHPVLGVAILAEFEGLDDDVCRVVAEHHERGDGSGFPSARTQDAISELAKIVGIVDWYDGMISRRGGRPAMLPHDAIRRLFLAGEQNQFDRSLIEIVIRSIGVYPTGSLVRLNTGEQAIVVAVNPQHRLKPRVKIIGGPHGESYVSPPCIDLAVQTDDRVPRTVAQVLDPAHDRVNVAMYLDDTHKEAA